MVKPKIFSALFFFVISIVIIRTNGYALDISKYKGKTFYTAHTFFLTGTARSKKQGRLPIHKSTNYRTCDIVLPINQKARVKKIAKNSIKVEIIDGPVRGFEIKHITKHSNIKLDSLFRRSFLPKPVDLSRFSDEVVKSIKLGDMRLGMTREEVLLARGYPPGHQTPDLSENKWTYWYRPMIRRNILFLAGKLYQGRRLVPLKSYIPPIVVDRRPPTSREYDSLRQVVLELEWKAHQVDSLQEVIRMLRDTEGQMEPAPVSDTAK